jgi:hypothetical protein
MKESKGMLSISVIALFLVTFICALVYLVTQQELRLGANVNPYQIAVDTSIKLEKGSNIKEIINGQNLDVSKGLGAFVMVFDNNKSLVATTGMMGSIKPSYPKGVLEYLDTHKEDRVTWQTKERLRFATVAIKYKNGYIVGAQSLLETENTIQKIGALVLFAWIASILCLALIIFLIYFFIKGEKNQK